ncbi:MAG: hypothetical protein JWP37_3771 [Mucilaginibacter sp.]|nr:hypothetical protein [Mucilaginibacter sp.]
MKAYFDKSIFANPVTNYFRWIGYKLYYQLKNWGKHLRINYGTVVRNCTFGYYNWVGNYNVILNCDIGSYTYIAGYSTVLNCKIGKYCSIASNVKISPGTHPTSGFVSIHPSTYMVPNFHAKKYVDENQFEYDEHVEIGNDVWICANVVIAGGVKIGNGAVIAANTVVTKNIGDYEIVGGFPAKFIKKRFTNDEIKVLNELKWWDKDEEWMKTNISRFWAVNEFVDHFKDRTA